MDQVYEVTSRASKAFSRAVHVCCLNERLIRAKHVAPPEICDGIDATIRQHPAQPRGAEAWF